LLHLVTRVAAVAHTICDPVEIDLAKEIEIGMARGSGGLDPRRALSEIVFAIHDGAEQIGVLHQQAVCPRNVLVLDRHLSARNRAVIAEFDRAAFLFRVRPDELGDEIRIVMFRELSSERRLARRFRTAEHNANHADTVAGIEVASDRFHAMCPSTASPRYTA
jgi:hypothetical protein